MSDFLNTLSRFVNEPTYKTNSAVFGLILVLNILGGLTVYLTGGTTFSYLHIMYLPIILGGFYFGPLAGIVGGIFSALIIGPYMPESVEAQIPQQSTTWLFRMCFFAGIGGIAGFFSGLSKAYSQSLEKQLYTDPITTLPNYQGLMRRLVKHHQGMRNIQGAIVIKLKQIGDIDKAFGPELAEKMLKNLADRLNHSVSAAGIVGRLEEGKFVVLVLKNHTLNSMMKMCYTALQQENMIDGIPVFIEFFYGLAEYEEGDNLNDLLRKAGNAVDRSLATNIFEIKYDPKLDQQAEKNIVILRELKQALDQDALNLVYQPKVEFKTGAVVGFEALSRWNHPTLGFVPTDQYIILAEKTSLINPHTEWVVRTAIQQLAFWQQRGEHVTVAVNFSMSNFTDADLIQHMFQLLETHKVSPELLEIEVTESVLATNLKKVADVLRSLQTQGIQITVDDFGTGLSSLRYLFELPINVLKIDQVFIQAMLHNSEADAIVRSTITLAHDLNYKVVAEGVETAEQYDALTKLGCDVAQGYYIAKPMSPKLATEWLQSRKGLQIF